MAAAPGRSSRRTLAMLLSACLPAGIAGWWAHLAVSATGVHPVWSWLVGTALAGVAGALVLRLRPGRHPIDPAVGTAGLVALGMSVAMAGGWIVDVAFGGPAAGLVVGIAFGAALSGVAAHRAAPAVAAGLLGLPEQRWR